MLSKQFSFGVILKISLRCIEFKNPKVGKKLATIEEIKRSLSTADTEFILVLTPLLREFEEGSTDKEIEVRQRLQQARYC